MRESDLTQAELASRAKVPQGNISLYLRDESRPSKPLLTRLCQSVGEHGVRLAIAFIRDEIPDDLEEQIVVEEISGKERPKDKDPFSRYSAYLRQFLLDAAHECEQRPEVLTGLEAVFKVMKKS